MPYIWLIFIDCFHAFFIDFSSESNKSTPNVDPGPISWLMDFSQQLGSPHTRVNNTLPEAVFFLDLSNG